MLITDACSALKEYPNLFDVGYTGIDEDSPEFEKEATKYMAKLGIQGVGPDDFKHSLPRHKYLLNVDGVLAAFRMASLLGAGSTVLMQKSYSEVFTVGAPFSVVTSSGHISQSMLSMLCFLRNFSSVV